MCVCVLGCVCEALLDSKKGWLKSVGLIHLCASQEFIQIKM